MYCCSILGGSWSLQRVFGCHCLRNTVLAHHLCNIGCSNAVPRQQDHCHGPLSTSEGLVTPLLALEIFRCSRAKEIVVAKATISIDESCKPAATGGRFHLDHTPQSRFMGWVCKRLILQNNCPLLPIRVSLPSAGILAESLEPEAMMRYGA